MYKIENTCGRKVFIKPVGSFGYIQMTGSGAH